MRYKNINIDDFDVDCLDFTNKELEGNVILCGTDELIEITNNIRKERGYTDLVQVDCDNQVYYNFYLVFNTNKKEVSIQAVCNYGEKDDEVWYKLPMSREEERTVLFTLIKYLANELYCS